MRQFVSVALAVLVTAAPGVTWAQAAEEPSPAQIRAAAEAFDRGREAYKAEQYQEAAEQFERADANAPSATALELALRSRDQAGNPDRAATLAALALARHDDQPALQKLASEVLGKLKPELYELTVGCDEACELIADSKIVHGARVLERTIYLLPGPHTLVAGFGEGRTANKSVEAQRGQSSRLNFEAPEAPPEQAPAPAPVTSAQPPPTVDRGPKKESSGWSPAVFWVGAGLTAVAGGVTIWSGVDTLNNPGADRVRDECADENCQLYKDGVAKQNRTNILIGVTGALGAATILIGALATDWSGGDDQAQALLSRKRAYRSLEISPWAGADGGGLGARGRF